MSMMSKMRALVISLEKNNKPATILPYFTTLREIQKSLNALSERTHMRLCLFSHLAGHVSSLKTKQNSIVFLGFHFKMISSRFHVLLYLCLWRRARSGILIKGEGGEEKISGLWVIYNIMYAPSFVTS